MLVQTGDPQNIYALVFGLVAILLGLLALANRVRLASFFGSVQSEFGRAGRRVARESRPWVVVVVGVGFVVFGLLLVAIGLFAHIAPPGTPR